MRSCLKGRITYACVLAAVISALNATSGIASSPPGTPIDLALLAQRSQQKLAEIDIGSRRDAQPFWPRLDRLSRSFPSSEFCARVQSQAFEVFDPNEAAVTLDKMHDAVFQTLDATALASGQDLQPLRGYLAMSMPSAADLPQQSGECTHHRPVVTSTSLNFAREYIVNVLGHLARTGQAARDVTISSTPPGARIQLLAPVINKFGPAKNHLQAGLPIRDAATDTVLHSIYLGIYFYALDKPGYKPVRGLVDLANQPNKMLCTLHPDNAVEGPFPCNTAR